MRVVLKFLPIPRVLAKPVKQSFLHVFLANGNISKVSDCLSGTGVVAYALAPWKWCQLAGGASHWYDV